MKHTMQKLTAAILALTCLPLTGVTAKADSTSYWSTATWDMFEGMERIDDYGMYTEETGELYLDASNRFTLVSPKTNSIRFTLRDGVDQEAAFAAALDILAPYYPELREQYQQGSGYAEITQTDTESEYQWKIAVVSLYRNGNNLDLWMKGLPEQSADLEAALLMGLARRRMLSAYYGYGETATWNPLQFDYGILCYPDHAEPTQGWDAVQAYLDEKHPGYAIERAEREFLGIYYRIVPSEELTVQAQFALLKELQDAFGMVSPVLISELAADSGTPALGHNALERPGDVTLDCEIDILDVIAVNKQLLGSATLCDTAAKNADVNASGKPDETDSLDILKYVVELSDTLG